MKDDQMTEITDDMCRRAIEAMKPDRIQGFSTPQDERRTKWGAPHYIRDVSLPLGFQVIWSGDSHETMMGQIQIEEMRLALRAAFTNGDRT